MLAIFYHNKGYWRRGVMKDDLLEKIGVRKLKLDDLDAIVEIDYRVFGTKRPSYWHQKIQEMGEGQPSKSLVAELDGTVQGFIMGGVSGWEFGMPNTVGWIDTIGVNPDYQKQGIATLLFKAITDEFEKEGVENIYTLVKWEDWDLMCFFKAMGFSRGNIINLEYKIK
jgi:ribosomal protein S18 acetylase RimI-like enzyme